MPWNREQSHDINGINVLAHASAVECRVVAAEDAQF